jgi:hypothetical protein
LTLT